MDVATHEGFVESILKGILLLLLAYCCYDINTECFYFIAQIVFYAHACMCVVCVCVHMCVYMHACVFPSDFM